jgi:hypothetical protein
MFASSHIYSDYDVLSEADFIGHGLKFEAADLENLIVDKPKILDFAPSTLSILCPLGSELFEQSAHSYFQVVTSYPMTSPLRC